MEIQILDEFVKEHELDRKKGFSEVFLNDLMGLKERGISLENLLNHLSTKYGSLLHGSRNEIFQDELIPNEKGEIYVCNLGVIALMKAVMSNKGLTPPGIKYPFFMDKPKSIRFEVYGINEETIGNKGFVYIINKSEGFENNPYKSWQYVHVGGKVNINAKIEVERKDFKHPIYDMTNIKIINCPA